MAFQYTDINFSENVKIFLEKINAEILERGIDYSNNLKYPPYIILDKRRSTYYMIGVALTESTDMIKNIIERVSPDDIILESICRLGEYIELSTKSPSNSIYKQLNQYNKKFAVLVPENLNQNMIFFLKSNLISSQRALIDGKYSFFFFNDQGLKKILNIYYKLRNNFKDKYRIEKNIEKIHNESYQGKNSKEQHSSEESVAYIDDKNKKNIIDNITEDFIANLSTVKLFLAEYIRNYEKKPNQYQITHQKVSIIDNIKESRDIEVLVKLNKYIKDKTAYSIDIIFKNEQINNKIDKNIKHKLITAPHDKNYVIATSDLYQNTHNIDIITEDIDKNHIITDKDSNDIGFIITSQNTNIISTNNTETIELKQKLKKAKKNGCNKITTNLLSSNNIIEPEDTVLITEDSFLKRKLSSLIFKNNHISFIYENLSILIDNTYETISNSLLFFPTYILDRLSNNKLPQALLFFIATLCTLFIGMYKIVLNALSSLFVPNLITYATKIESLYMKKIFKASYHILSLDNYLKSDNILNGINLSIAFNKSILYFLNSTYYLQYMLALAFSLTIIPLTRLFAKKLISFMLFSYIFYYPIFFIGNYGISIILNKTQSIEQLENNFLAIVSGIYVISILTPIITIILAYTVSKNQKKDFD